jgi:tetraacyldisaccharide 4'-kinase
MLSPREFRNLVSGRRRGLRAACLRAALGAIEVPYGLAVRWRNRRYDRSVRLVRRVGVPVISVGNLTLGGTGKTPMVAWTARRLRRQGLRVTIVSRGYGAEAGGVNDEALELERQLPDVPHLQNPDRVEAAELAIEEFGCQVILLDDGFQHRRIHRDLDMVLIDALEPFGFGRIFPRGTLREPLSGLRRAGIVVLTRADMLERGARQEIRARVAQLAPGALWAEVSHAPEGLLAASGHWQPVASLAGLKVAAFCAVGNPAGFQHTLADCGYRVVAFREFPDHHPYNRGDIESLASWAQQAGASALVCTAKDLVKISVDRLERLPLWALAIGIEFLSGQEIVEARLDEVAAGGEAAG